MIIFYCCCWFHSLIRFICSRQYVPVNGERVVGTVVSKVGFACRVDIGANELATLSLLAFEGATKRNRPDVNVGDVVFARIIAPARAVEAELVCITSAIKRDGMGVLQPPASHYAQVIQVPVHTSRTLLDPECKILPLMGKKYRFEIAIGMNGRIWISSKTPENVIYISNLISRSSDAGSEEMTQLCDDLHGDVDISLIAKQRKVTAKNIKRTG